MGFSLAIYGIILYYSIVGGRNANLDKFKKMYKQKERVSFNEEKRIIDLVEK